MKKILYSCIGVIDGVENNIVHARVSEDFEDPDLYNTLSRALEKSDDPGCWKMEATALLEKIKGGYYEN